MKLEAITLQPLNGAQYVTHPSTTDNPPYRETIDMYRVRMHREFNKARGTCGLPPVERRRYRGKA